MLYGTILCLGDSMTFGARSPIGYPEYLGPLVSTDKVEWVSINKGISGQTTRQILDRAPAAVGQLAGMAGPKWCVVMAGTNDSKAGGLPHHEWEMLYRQLLHWPLRHNIPLALCTLPGVDPAEMPSFAPNSNRWLREASNRIRGIADELSSKKKVVSLVEFDDMSSKYLCDGVHFTKQGYLEMAQRIAAAITWRSFGAKE